MSAERTSRLSSLRLLKSLPPAARESLAPGKRAAGKRGLAELERRFARLNHVLIPDKKSERDKLRSGVFLRVLQGVFGIYSDLSREGRALLVLAVPVGFAALDVRFSQVHLLFAMLIGLLVGSWLCRPMFRVPGLRVDVATAPRVSVGTPAHFDLSFSNQGPRALVNLRIAPPFLPWDGRWKTAPEGVAILEPGRRSRATASAVFRARGEHHLDSFEIGQLVSTGLAVGPRLVSAGVRFLVVPKLANVETLGLDELRPEIDYGSSTAVRVGEADFAGVRPYRIGDPLKHLHARTWARTGEPHVREFVDPQDERVALLVVTDCGESTELQREAALSLASGVAARLALHGRGIDLLLCGGKCLPVQPRTGQAALDFVLDRLATIDVLAQTEAALPLVQDVLDNATSAVLVSSGADVRIAALIERARQAGRACTWAAVVDSAAKLAHPAASLVEVDDINTGKRIAL